MIPAIAAVESAKCVALASRDLGRAHAAAANAGVERAYGSYEELLGDPEIDAVYIPLPNQLHVTWSDRALNAGKAVLCEKPLCLVAAEVQQLIAIRDDVGGLIEEALVFRNHPQWRFIADLLANGRIGAPLAVQGTIAKQFLDPADIRNQPRLGGGTTYDLGTYVIAACSLVFGRAPLRVTASMDIDPVFGIDRLITALLDYGGAQASFTGSSQGGTSGWGTHQQFSVLGSTGWLRSNFPYAQARATSCGVEIGDETSVGGLPTEVQHFPPTNQYVLQVERFSRLVRGEAVDHWPIEDSLLTLRIIEALFRAAREGSWVELS
jgi:predicted dehydrogenase